MAGVGGHFLPFHPICRALGLVTNKQAPLLGHSSLSPGPLSALCPAVPASSSSSCAWAVVSLERTGPSLSPRGPPLTALPRHRVFCFQLTLTIVRQTGGLGISIAGGKGSTPYKGDDEVRSCPPIPSASTWCSLGVVGLLRTLLTPLLAICWVLPPGVRLSVCLSLSLSLSLLLGPSLSPLSVDLERNLNLGRILEWEGASEGSSEPGLG